MATFEHPVQMGGRVLGEAEGGGTEAEQSAEQEAGQHGSFLEVKGGTRCRSIIGIGPGSGKGGLVPRLDKTARGLSTFFSRTTG
ncbi:hypothetical protein PproGo58_14690 [Pseudomonas protegens]|nr:hypothetical protein PproGo58_14690 [Pseudomonas protegens]